MGFTLVVILGIAIAAVIVAGIVWLALRKTDETGARDDLLEDEPRADDQEQ